VFKAVEQTTSTLLQDLDGTPTLEVYHSIRHRVEELRKTLNGTSLNYATAAISAKKDMANKRLDTVSLRLKREWKPAIETLLGGVEFNCDHHYNRPVDQFTRLTQLFMLLIVIVRVIIGLSRRDSEFILSFIFLAFDFVIKKDNPRTIGQTREQMPSTVDTIMSKFQLDGKCVEYAVCPECNCTYAPNESQTYPSVCDNKPTPESECGAALLKENGAPLKIFDHHRLADYVAGLLSQPDIEREIDQACQDFLNDEPDSSYMRSPFDAAFLKTFTGPKDGQLFCDGQGEARLMFSLCVDFFNPEGTSRRGKHTSVGIISVACLNLPGDIRYRPENMWIDIIPGPREPALTELNHYMRPLIDEMLVSWTRGIQLSRTAGHQHGRLARCAIVIGVCDLPAARKLASLAPHGHMIFCSTCNCWHALDAAGRPIKDLDFLRRRTDHQEWERRNVAELRSAAERWRTAATEAEQEAIFDSTGVRWSELWRLPYWDPTRMLVVDAMHCLLEGLARFNTLKVLRLTESDAKAPAARQPAFNHPFKIPHVQDESVSDDLLADSDAEDDAPLRRRPFGHPWTRKDVNHVLRIHTILRAPYVDGEIENEDDDKYTTNEPRMLKWLSGRVVDALKFVTDDLKLTVEGSGWKGRKLKDDYIRALVAWVRFSSIIM
jgi:hypothetical protein